MKKIIIILIILILAAAAYWLFSVNKNTKEASQPTQPTDNIATAPAVQAENKTVTIQNFAFNPAIVEIKAGETVVWQHNDSAPHTVTADNGLFESGRLNKGGEYSFKFTEPGEYSYHCGIHPYMTAKIIVK